MRPHSLPGALEGRRHEVERSTSILADRLEVEGFVELTGAGEATLEVEFPVAFTEIPSISDGGHLIEGQVLVAGQFPRWNVGVAQWRTMPNRPGAAPLYTGALLVIVAEGPEGMRSVAHYQFRGRALRNPISPDE